MTIINSDRLKPFLIITGMHRSGTSFLCRALNMAGVGIGGISALSRNDWLCDDNKKGHWEHADFNSVADTILEHSGGSWHQIPDQLTISEDQRTQFANIIRDLLAQPALATGFKDPRSLLLLEEIDSLFNPGMIIAGIFRHPLKVAESLKIRNGFSYDHSVSLWIEYNQRLLKSLDRYKGYLFNFDWTAERLFTELRELYACLGLFDVDLEAWYSEDLRRSDNSYNQEYPLPESAQSIYAELQTVAASNSTVQLPDYSPPGHSELIEIVRYEQLEGQRLNDEFRENLGRAKQYATKVEKQRDELQRLFDQLNDRYFSLHDRYQSIDENVVLRNIWVKLISARRRLRANSTESS